MCVAGATATPRTPRLVPGRVKDSTRLNPWSMSYTLTGPSLKMYSRWRRPRRRATAPESVGAAAATLDGRAGAVAEEPRAQPADRSATRPMASDTETRLVIHAECRRLA